MTARTKDPMPVKAIAPWFGGKRTMAASIVAELGPHTQYVEPFCGSMAIILAKPESSQETAADLHGDLTNLARVLQLESAAVTLYERLQRTLFAEDLLYEAHQKTEFDFTATEPDVDRAYWFFVRSWMMRNGIAGTNKQRGAGTALAVRFTHGGGSPTVRFKSAIESIPAWHERLRNVVILRRDSFQLLDKFDDTEKLAIYADPPYVPESRSGYHGSGATSRYVYEFQHGGDLFGDDHDRLRDALARFKRARVVVSYYDCKRIRELYDGWTFVEHTRRKNLHAQNGRGARPKEAPEVLIINGPSRAEGRLFQ